jgi:hypothetical protein
MLKLFLLTKPLSTNAEIYFLTFPFSSNAATDFIDHACPFSAMLKLTYMTTPLSSYD